MSRSPTTAPTALMRDPTDNSDTDTDTIVAAPDLFITKDDGLTVVTAGNTVTYTINFGNDGSQDATGVVITETLPPGSTFNAAGSTPGWTETAPGSGIYEFIVGALNVGDTGSVTFSVICRRSARRRHRRPGQQCLDCRRRHERRRRRPHRQHRYRHGYDQRRSGLVHHQRRWTNRRFGRRHSNVHDQLRQRWFARCDRRRDHGMASGRRHVQRCRQHCRLERDGAGQRHLRIQRRSARIGHQRSVTFSVIVDDPLAAGIDLLFNNVRSPTTARTARTKTPPTTATPTPTRSAPLRTSTSPRTTDWQSSPLAIRLRTRSTSATTDRRMPPAS